MNRRRGNPMGRVVTTPVRQEQVVLAGVRGRQGPPGPSGDAVLRQDLANPDKGAAMVARAPICVDSIADLLALPEWQRKEGLRYLVKGYHPGSDVGGGEFYWVEGLTGSADQITTFGVGIGGLFVRASEELTVEMAGYLEADPSTHAAAISRMKAFINDNANAYFKNAAKLSKSFADVVNKKLGGGLVTISALGDSITYGGGAGASFPPINGSNAPRFEYVWPEVLQAQLNTNGFSANVKNLGYGGDRTELGLSRWPNGAEGRDVACYMYGTNDARENSGDGDPLVSPEQYRANLIRLVQRDQIQGSFCFLMKPPLNLTGTGEPASVNTQNTRDRRIRAYHEIIEEVGTLCGVPVIDASEILCKRPRIFADTVHPNARGHNILGSNLAAYFLCMNFDPPKIAPFDEVTPNFRNLALPISPVSGSASLGWRYEIPENDYIYIAAHFTEDVFPVIRTLNDGSSASMNCLLTINGGLNRDTEAYSAIEMINTGTGWLGRQNYVGPRLHSGPRVLHIRTSVGSAKSIIERISFIPADQAIKGNDYTFWRKSELSGRVLRPDPAYNRSCLVDYSEQLRGRFVIKADLTMPPNSAGQFCGIGLARLERILPSGQPGTHVRFVRIASSLTIVSYDLTTEDTITVPDVFTDGDDYSVELRVDRQAVTVMINGSSVGTFTIAAKYSDFVYPMVIASSLSAPMTVRWLEWQG